MRLCYLIIYHIFNEHLDIPDKNNLLPKSLLSEFAVVWWVWVDSNHRPHPYQGCALTKLSYRPKLAEGIRIHSRSAPNELPTTTYSSS